MAKDPAFLFYSQDFIMGVMCFNNEQVGIYIKLLCIQHQHGGMVHKDTFNSMIYNNEIIRSKFIETDDGFFNERLMEEMEKRAIKSKNLSANAKKRWLKHKQCKSNAIASNLHMPIEDENENEIKKKREVFTKPLIKEIILYCKERNNRVNPNKFYNYYESNGWKVGKNKMKNWKAAIRNWETMENDSFNGNGKPKSVTQPEYKHFEETSDKDKQALDDLMKNTRIKGVV